MALINDVLDMAKLESGKAESSMESLSCRRSWMTVFPLQRDSLQAGG